MMSRTFNLPTSDVVHPCLVPHVRLPEQQRVPRKSCGNRKRSVIAGSGHLVSSLSPPQIYAYLARASPRHPSPSHSNSVRVLQCPRPLTTNHSNTAAEDNDNDLSRRSYSGRSPSPSMYRLRFRALATEHVNRRSAEAAAGSSAYMVHQRSLPRHPPHANDVFAGQGANASCHVPP
jgi:hypothetical protein